jgi:chromate reductase
MINLIVGTNRPESNSRLVANQVIDIYKKLGVSLNTIDLANLPAEIFHPSSYATKPASFLPMSDAVVASDGLIIVAPEYNGSLPGVLKYFIDMLKFPESFEKRPVCFIGVAAGIWGALRPIEQLELIFGYRNAFIYPERVFLPKINDLLGTEKKITDKKLLSMLENQATGFIDFVERLRGIKLKNK